MKEHGAIIVEGGRRRWLALLLLCALVFGSVLVVGLAAWTYANHTEQEQNELLVDVQDKLAKAASERSQISVITVRAQALILRSAQEQTRLQLCVLKPKMHLFCHGVSHDARNVVKAIDHIQRDIHQFIMRVQTHTLAPQPGGTGTVTITPTTAPPTRGESDQCPPNNPHC